MVVADECKIQQEPNSCYKWNPQGKTPIIKVSRERKSISIYGGLSLLSHKVISHFCAWQESSETIAFLDKIKKYWERLCYKTNSVNPILLVWDNARWHKSKEVRQWLENNPGVVELMNFPPYTPELNPQEHVWKALKKHLFESLVRDKFDITAQKTKSFLKNRKFHYKFF